MSESQGLVFVMGGWIVIFGILLAFGPGLRSLTQIFGVSRDARELLRVMRQRFRYLPQVYEKFRQDGLAALDPKSPALLGVPQPDPEWLQVTVNLILGADGEVIQRGVRWRAEDQKKRCEGAQAKLEAVAHCSHAAAVGAMIAVFFVNGSLPSRAGMALLLCSLIFFSIWVGHLRAKVSDWTRRWESHCHQLELWEMAFRVGVSPQQFSQLLQATGSGNLGDNGA